MENVINNGNLRKVRPKDIRIVKIENYDENHYVVTYTYYGIEFPFRNLIYKDKLHAIIGEELGI